MLVKGLKKPAHQHKIAHPSIGTIQHQSITSNKIITLINNSFFLTKIQITSLTLPISKFHAIKIRFYLILMLKYPNNLWYSSISIDIVVQDCWIYLMSLVFENSPVSRGGPKRCRQHVPSLRIRTHEVKTYYTSDYQKFFVLNICSLRNLF